MLALAEKRNASFLHISTTSVGGLFLDGEKQEKTVKFDEQKLYIGQNLDNVYLRSKFEAERLVLKEALSGMDARILRMQGVFLQA